MISQSTMLTYKSRSQYHQITDDTHRCVRTNLVYGVAFKEGLSLIREEEHTPLCPRFGVAFMLVARREDKILHFIYFLHFFEP